MQRHKIINRRFSLQVYLRAQFYTVQASKASSADLGPDKQSTVEYILSLMVNKERRNLLFRVGCACSLMQMGVLGC